MIPCDDIRSHLSDYFDEECVSPLRETITAHLLTCADCQAELAALTQMTERVFQPHKQPAPAFLWTRVLAAIEAEEERRGIPWWAQWRWMVRLTATAAIFVGLGSAFLFHQAKIPLESVLQGRSGHQRAIQMASTKWTSPHQTAMQLVLGDESWAQN